MINEILDGSRVYIYFVEIKKKETVCPNKK